MALLTTVIKDENGEQRIKWEIFATYGIIFLINLLYDIISAGGIGSVMSLGWIFLGDSTLKAFFITLVIFAGNAGIAWKQGQE